VRLVRPTFRSNSLSAPSPQIQIHEPVGCKIVKFCFRPAGQRLVLLRLKEGPIFLALFAKEMKIKDAAGKQGSVSGLFGALSFDEGQTWPVRRLITDDGPGVFFF